MRKETNSGEKTAEKKETEVMDEAVMLPLNHRRTKAGKRAEISRAGKQGFLHTGSALIQNQEDVSHQDKIKLNQSCCSEHVQ